MRLPRVSLSSRALPYHLTAQFIYIWATCSYAALPRNLWFYAGGLALAAALDGALRRLFQKNSPAAVWLHFSVINIVSSCFINIETYTFAAFLFCIFLAMISKVCFVGSDGRHVFNPSAFAGVAGSVLLPSVITLGSESWGAHWPWLNLLVFSAGIVATTLAGTLPLVLSYLLGFAVISACGQWILLSTGWMQVWERDSVPIFFWSATLLSVGSIIFMFGVIGDPITAPRRRSSQMLFGLSIAFWDYLLRRNLVVMSGFFAYLISQSLRVALRDFGVLSLFTSRGVMRRFPDSQGTQ